MITQSSFDFLNAIKENNNREWFQQNKKWYESSHQEMIDFADSLLIYLQSHDFIETESGKKSLYRIYRDIRFSKDKSPYKSSFSGSFRRATNALRGGYYFHIEPGNTFLAGGFWGPNKEDMKLLRKHIANDSDTLREIINNSLIKGSFKQLEGEQLKTAPKGYAKDHPAIDLLRYKQFILRCPFEDEQVLETDFDQVMSSTFKKMRPFLDYMSQILTTDLNGISIIS